MKVTNLLEETFQMKNVPNFEEEKTMIFKVHYFEFRKCMKQAGAELCQAQTGLS